MFCVSEDEATAIRSAFEQEGDLSAGAELGDCWVEVGS